MNQEQLQAPVQLYGYSLSVYTWIARLALHEKIVRYDSIEVDPFADTVSPDYLALHPFNRVPALKIGDFVLFETGAITRFVDDTFDGPCLQPKTPVERARVNQIVSIVDSYAYWPLVRQVFSHGIFRSLEGEAADASELKAGLTAAASALDSLEDLSGDESFLVGASLSVADIHLAPMISYFMMVDEGRKMISHYPILSRWIATMELRPAFRDTKPCFESLQAKSP